MDTHWYSYVFECMMQVEMQQKQTSGEWLFLDKMRWGVVAPGANQIKSNNTTHLANEVRLQQNPVVTFKEASLFKSL